MKRTALSPVVGMMAALAIIIAVSSHAFGQKKSLTPKPKLVTLDPSAAASSEILTGSPETVTMRSGYVVLVPGHSVGIHSTKGNEETAIVLSGNGEMRITGGATLKIHRYTAAYCPPHTEHNVVNTGTDTLRYVYVVAKAEGWK